VSFIPQLQFNQCYLLCLQNKEENIIVKEAKELEIKDKLQNLIKGLYEKPINEETSCSVKSQLLFSCLNSIAVQFPFQWECFTAYAPW
jgi:hypothetical protein